MYKRTFVGNKSEKRWKQTLIRFLLFAEYWISNLWPLDANDISDAW